MTGAPQAEWWKGVPIPEGSKPAEMGWGEYLDSLGRKVASGVMLGWADEAAAGMDALTQPVLGRGSEAPSISERYNQNLAKEQGRDKAFDAEYPKAATAAELTGNVAGTVAALPRAVISPAATVMGNVIKGGAVGSGLGAVSGAGNADPGKRLEGAEHGAILGGAVGGAVAPVAQVASRVGPAVLDYMGLRNAEKGAVTQLLRAFERDGVAPEEAMKRYQAWQQAGAKPEVLADLGGENVRSLADVAAQVPGASRTAAQDLVASRKAGAGERISGDVATAISPSKDYAGTIETLIEQRSKDATPLYQKAFAESGPVDVTPLISEIDSSIGTAKGGIKNALSQARALLLDAKGNPDTSLAGLHQTKLALDDMISGARQSGMGNTAKRELVQMKEKLVKAMDDASGGEQGLYASARRSFAGPSQSMDAMELGRSILKEDADVTAAEIKKLSDGDKDFFRAGVAKAILSAVENVKDGRNVVASFFDKPSLRSKLAAAFDNPEDFQRFKLAMDREANIATGNNAYNPRGGSATFRREAGAADMERDPAGPIMGYFEGGIPGAVKGLVNKSLRANQTMNSATADALAPLAFETDMAKNLATLQRLSETPSYPAVRSARDQIARTLLRGPVAAEQAGDMAAPRKPLVIDVRPSDARR